MRVWIFPVVGLMMACSPEESASYGWLEGETSQLRDAGETQVFELETAINEEGRPKDKKFIGSSLEVVLDVVHFADGCFSEECAVDLNVRLERGEQVEDKTFTLQPGDDRRVQVTMPGWFDDCPEREACSVDGLLTVSISDAAWVEMSVEGTATLNYEGKLSEDLELEGTIRPVVDEDN